MVKRSHHTEHQCDFSGHLQCNSDQWKRMYGNGEYGGHFASRSQARHQRKSTVLSWRQYGIECWGQLQYVSVVNGSQHAEHHGECSGHLRGDGKQFCGMHRQCYSSGKSGSGTTAGDKRQSDVLSGQQQRIDSGCRLQQLPMVDGSHHAEHHGEQCRHVDGYGEQCSRMYRQYECDHNTACCTETYDNRQPDLMQWQQHSIVNGDIPCGISMVNGCHDKTDNSKHIGDLYGNGE